MIVRQSVTDVTGTTALTVERLRLSAGVLAPRTLRAYAHDWKLFTAWCEANGRQSLPASTDDVAEYLTARLNGGRKITTAKRHFSSILHYHREHGAIEPSSQAILRLLLGAQRLRHEQPTQKEPVTVSDLQEIAQRTPRGITAVRNRALLFVGFASALRRSSLAELTMTDLRFTGEGLIIHVRFEKQDQAGVGRYIAIPTGKHPATCPIAALKAWIALRGGQAGYLFQRTLGGRLMGKMHPNRISMVLKEEIARLGRDPDLYGAHSLRSGLVTEAVDAGVSELVIARQTGHASLSSLRRYYRPRNPFRGAGNACTALDL